MKKKMIFLVFQLSGELFKNFRQICKLIFLIFNRSNKKLKCKKTRLWRPVYLLEYTSGQRFVSTFVSIKS